MPRNLLLLLTLLGSGSTLQLWENAKKAAPAPLPARVRRQVTLEEDYNDEDYNNEGTDPPETLSYHDSVAVNLDHLTTTGTLEPRASSGPGTPNLATVENTTGHPNGTATEEPSTELAMSRIPVTVTLPTELTSVITPTTEVAPTEGAAATEDLSSGPGVTEAETTPSAVTEAETTAPVATEAETTLPAATEAKTTLPVVKEETTPPAATEMETTLSLTTEALSMKSVVTEAVSTEPFTVKSLSVETTTAATTVFVIYKGALVTAKNLKSSQVVFPGGSVAPSPTGTSDLIPVKQCLLAILILALVATVFLVCTVVLAVRLSRKTHTYPVRNYSPTEMVCISALLPDGGEGLPTTANGGLAKSQGLKVEAREDLEGDDLTLHSFLP